MQPSLPHLAIGFPKLSASMSFRRGHGQSVLPQFQSSWQVLWRTGIVQNCTFSLLMTLAAAQLKRVILCATDMPEQIFGL